MPLCICVVRFPITLQLIGVVDEQIEAVVSLEIQERLLIATYTRSIRLYRLNHAIDLWFLTKERITTLRRSVDTNKKSSMH